MKHMHINSSALAPNSGGSSSLNNGVIIEDFHAQESKVLKCLESPIKVVMEPKGITENGCTEGVNCKVCTGKEWKRE